MDQRGPTSPDHRSRTFSFRSDNSGNRADDLVESPREKERRDSIWKNQSKANPNAAMNEAQPGESNLLEKTTIEPLRNFQHKDVKGNVITDPDLSNPTRPRLERPLDTIRSFERAIDSGYKRKSSMMRSESYNDQNNTITNNNQHMSNRNSYYGGYDNAQRGPSQYGPGSYGSRKLDSYADGPSGPPNSFPQRMRYGSRMQSDPAMMRSGSGVYPQHGYHQSHDTVNTGMTYNSDSTGQWGNSTDPSSENSSIERMQATSKPYGQQDGLGPSDRMQTPIMEEQSYGKPGPLNNEQRRPIPLGSSNNNAAPLVPRSGNLPSTTRPEPEKRQSWIKRRFSKRS